MEFPFGVQGSSDEKDLDKATILSFLEVQPFKKTPLLRIIQHIGKAPGYTNKLLYDLESKDKVFSFSISKDSEIWYRKL